MQMTEEEYKADYRKRFLTYSFKGVLFPALSIFIPLVCVSLFLGEDFKWSRIAVYAIAALGFGFLEITRLRYLDKKGKLFSAPFPKYGFKSWKQHQADKAKSKDA